MEGRENGWKLCKGKAKRKGERREMGGGRREEGNVDFLLFPLSTFQQLEHCEKYDLM
jgi:hypothetical protein